MALPMDTTSRRTQPRKDIRVSVRVEQASRLQQFHSRNLSSGGIYLEVKGDVPAIGTKLRLNFEVPGLNRTIEAEAEVIYHHNFESMDEKMETAQKMGIGLKFLSLKGGDREMIEKYVTGKDLHVRS